MTTTTERYTAEQTAWEDPTGFDVRMVLDEANNWTKRETGKQMLMNYAAFLKSTDATRLQSLEAENARYKAALELIALDDGFEDEAEDLQSIARNALKED